MREIIAEQAAKAAHPDMPASDHYEALALLAAFALIPLAIVMGIDRYRKRRR